MALALAMYVIDERIGRERRRRGEGERRRQEEKEERGRGLRCAALLCVRVKSAVDKRKKLVLKWGGVGHFFCKVFFYDKIPSPGF